MAQNRTAIGIIVLLTFVSGSAVPATHKYFPAGFLLPPDPPQPWFFNSPRDVACDPAGNVYVVDTGNHRIQRFTGQGIFVTKWGSKGTQPRQFMDPHGIAVDGAGFVYVADTGNNRIQKFTGAGRFIQAFGASGGGPLEFSQPEDVAVDAGGNLFVADTGNHRVQKLTSQGTLADLWGARGGAQGQFEYPRAIAVDQSGCVYVSDDVNLRIQKFSSDGVFLRAWEGAANTQGPGLGGLAVESSGQLYAARDVIHKLGLDLNLIEDWACAGLRVYGTAADSFGNVYGVSPSEETVFKFSNAGQLLDEWGDRRFYPKDVAIGPQGEVVVCDLNNARILKYERDGSFITQWGRPQITEGVFSWYPSGIAVAPAGAVYVTDYDNRRVLKFNANGNHLLTWYSWYPSDVAVDSAGDVYVMSRGGVSKYSQSGEQLAQLFGFFESPGDGTIGRALDADPTSGIVYLIYEYWWQGWYHGPDPGSQTMFRAIQAGESVPPDDWTTDVICQGVTDVACDGSGYVYLLNKERNAVEKYDPNMNLLTEWGQTPGAGYLNKPGALAADPWGDVCVCEWGMDRVQKFALLAYGVGSVELQSRENEFSLSWSGLGPGPFTVLTSEDLLTWLPVPGMPTTDTSWTDDILGRVGRFYRVRRD